MFFFEKKNQKTFGVEVDFAFMLRIKQQSFLLLFFKKEGLFLRCPRFRRAAYMDRGSGHAPTEPDMIPLLAATSAADAIGTLAGGAVSALKTLASGGSSENFAALLSAHGVDPGHHAGAAAPPPEVPAHRLLHHLA